MSASAASISAAFNAASCASSIGIICVCSFVCSWLLCCGILAAALSLHPVRVIASANAAPVKIHFFLILFLILHIRLECIKCSRYPARLQVKSIAIQETGFSKIPLLLYGIRCKMISVKRSAAFDSCGRICCNEDTKGNTADRRSAQV